MGLIPPSSIADGENVGIPPLATKPGSHVLLEEALAKRNEGWRDNPQIPSWVNPETVGLDRFFTRTEVARSCYTNLLDVMEKDYAREPEYKIVEPSAGEGAFFDLLPKKRRIGIELVQGRDEFECSDFLQWNPRDDGHRYVVVGNPPFGCRAWLALAFINHAAKIADYIGMILPMAFQSNGKGSPKFRVIGAELVKTEYLPQDAFISPDGNPVQVNALWQVWRRGVNNRKPASTCDQWIDLFTVDHRKERLCGQNRLSEAYWFLQRTYYGDPPSLVTKFSEVKYGCGYGIVIKKDKKRVTSALRQTDWIRHSNLAAHNCRHISMEHIRAALVEAGFVDKK